MLLGKLACGNGAFRTVESLPMLSPQSVSLNSILALVLQTPPSLAAPRPRHCRKHWLRKSVPSKIHLEFSRAPDCLESPIPPSPAAHLQRGIIKLHSSPDYELLRTLIWQKLPCAGGVEHRVSVGTGHAALGIPLAAASGQRVL